MEIMIDKNYKIIQTYTNKNAIRVIKKAVLI